MKVAIFKRLGDPALTYESILKQDEVKEGSVWSRDYIQISQWAEVPFEPLPAQEVVSAQLQALDGAESELRNKFEEKLSQINTARSELRALTHQVQS